MGQITFVVSTGRTGTQAIAESVARVCPDTFLSLHEPRPSRIFRIFSNMRMAGLCSDVFFENAIIRLRREILTKLGERNYLESNNFMFGMVDILAFHYDAKIIHVVRHPVDYAVSHIKHGAFSGVKGMAGRFFPYWLSRPSYRGYSSSAWISLSQHQRLFWVWRLVNEYIAELGQRNPDNYSCYRFEDIFGDPVVYRSLMSEIGVADPGMRALDSEMRRKANQGKGGPGVMTDEDADFCVEVCRDLAASYGYELVS